MSCLFCKIIAGDIPSAKVYEDEHVLIVNKPSGVLSQKASDKDMSVNEWFIGYLLHKGKITRESLISFKPSICNRLDRNTSGLLICGKSLIGSQQLNQWIDLEFKPRPD